MACLPALALAVAAGCAGNVVVERAPIAYRLLADGSLATSGPAPVALHVRGRLEQGRFSAEGDVAGDGEMAGGDGHPGWMELADGSFHGNETGRAPFRPYVEGELGADGKFRPRSRQVVR